MMVNCVVTLALGDKSAPGDKFLSVSVRMFQRELIEEERSHHPELESHHPTG